ncbi:glycosyltransferase family 25 protein [Cognatiyoonia sp. IB215182]|uniref:glycosyltransferase family 25 protein n=1 Tax=Cognatiyoonia sp. IB215182 TaxID=3097353 RepID=UPI002A12B94F|nr:glycosyltransferase family 25 protein [Cognatiyoonia sp. IB215182]MDX8354737.1 glycosyltransferase family 25 protein [Cognatiyoonia sp. IB215182]
MERQFRSLGLKTTRMAAVDGRALEQADIPLLSTRAKERWRLTPTEIACALSHRKVWRKICASGHEYATVFEDDILISQKIRTVLQDDAWVPEAVDCVKIDTSEIVGFHTDFRSANLPGFRLSRSVSDMRSTAGYIISREAAARLLLKTQIIGGPIDVQMFSVGDPDFLELNYRQLHPAVCTQANHNVVSQFLPKAAASSTIAPPKPKKLVQRQRMPFGWKKIKRELFRPIRRTVAKVQDISRALYYRLMFRAKLTSVSFEDTAASFE